jgi:SpoVK/Ycf46/Vps4 family AAA+-type ATPase
MDKNHNIEVDFVHLARIALTGRSQDIQAFLHRVAKQRRDTGTPLSAALIELLRSSPTRASPLRRQAETALPVDADTRFQLMRVEEHPALDHEPVFAEEVAEALDRLVKERTRLKTLFEAGLEPTKAALFTGLPGVGKTLAARWIARALGKPLIVLDLAAVMSSYLGRTGTNLRQVLEYAKSVDCVLLLDEVDAVAKRRDDRGEIGELKRLVTVLLQEIDDWPSSGLLIAATNHPDLLDPAIWRRFEMTLEFPLPSREAGARFIEAALAPRAKNASAWAGILSLAFQGSSFSDIERALKTAQRSAALNGKKLDDHLVDLVKGQNLSREDRIALAIALVEKKLASQRLAQDLTGVARDTIRSRTKTSKTSRNAKEVGL